MNANVYPIINSLNGKVAGSDLKTYYYNILTTNYILENYYNKSIIDYTFSQYYSITAINTLLDDSCYGKT